MKVIIVAGVACDAARLRGLDEKAEILVSVNNSGSD